MWRFSKSHGSGRVGSGLVGSGQEVSKLSRVGPGHPPDPTRTRPDERGVTRPLNCPEKFILVCVFLRVYAVLLPKQILVMLQVFYPQNVGVVLKVGVSFFVVVACFQRVTFPADNPPSPSLAGLARQAENRWRRRRWRRSCARDRDGAGGCWSWASHQEDSFV